jgi:hypothetical protein
MVAVRWHPTKRSAESVNTASSRTFAETSFGCSPTSNSAAVVLADKFAICGVLFGNMRLQAGQFPDMTTLHAAILPTSTNLSRRSDT